MKKLFKKSNIFSFILGAIIFGGIVGVSAYTILANDIGYTPSDSTWKKSNGDDITNVKDAIDELYIKKSFGQTFSNASYEHSTSINNTIELDLTSGNYICDASISISNNTTSSGNSDSTSDITYSYNGCDEYEEVFSIDKKITSSSKNGNVSAIIHNNTKKFKCIVNNNKKISVNFEFVDRTYLSAIKYITCTKIQ